MCQQCVKEEFPDRGSFCLDTGTYIVNLSGCCVCDRKDTLEVRNQDQQELSDTAQEVTHYDHVCSECNHVIAHHEHKFWIEDDYQCYEMSCLLCGEAEDSRSCLPEDPRYNSCIY